MSEKLKFYPLRIIQDPNKKIHSVFELYWTRNYQAWWTLSLIYKSVKLYRATQVMHGSSIENSAFPWVSFPPLLPQQKQLAHSPDSHFTESLAY